MLESYWLFIGLQLHEMFSAELCRGVGPAGVGTSASFLSSCSYAAKPSSTADNSASANGMSSRSRNRFALASRSCAFVESFGR